MKLWVVAAHPIRTNVVIAEKMKFLIIFNPFFGQLPADLRSSFKYIKEILSGLQKFCKILKYRLN
jgi:hypothetical protein